MSSTIDNMTCPECGGNAQRESDHKTGEIYEHCNQCDYEEIITKGEVYWFSVNWTNHFYN